MELAKTYTKAYNFGDLMPDRIEDFKKLFAFCEQYKHVNQYDYKIYI